MKNKKQSRPLSAEDLVPMLILAWESAGHQFGVNHHLQLRQLLQHFPPGKDLQELKFLLAPVFADNPQQQEQFYQLFDQVYQKSEDKLKAHQGRVAELKKGEQDEDLHTIKQVVFSSAFLAILALVIALGVYGYYKMPALLSSAPAVETPSGIEEEAIAENEPPANQTFGNSQPGLPDKWKTQHNLLDTMTMTNDPSRAIDGINTRISFGDGLTYFSWAKAAYLGLVAALIWGIPWWLRRRRQSFSLAQQPKRSAPHSWNLKIPNLPTIDLGEVFSHNLRAMLRLDQKPSSRIDVAKTIEASASRAGAVDFQYLALKERRPYLILQDISSPQNHRSKLLDHFLQSLQAEGAPLERYYFAGDPRSCWQEDETKQTTLQHLAHSTQNHQLILCTDAHQLLRRNRELADWTDVFTVWRQKLILSPRAYCHWDEREDLLSQHFRLLPTTPNSLPLLVEALETIEPIEYAKTGEADADHAFYHPLDIPPALQGRALITFLEDTFVYPEGEQNNEVLLQWMAACAIPPNLFWDWTLHVGQLLSKPTRNEVHLENLFQLIRLPWFVSGKMPEEVRRTLLDYLEEKHPEFYRRLRRSWDTFLNLEENIPPPGSLAWEGHRIQVLLNELLQDPNWVKQRQLELELERLLQGKPAQDALLIKYQTQKQGAADALLSDRFRRFVQTQEKHFKRLRPWVWQVPLFICTAVFSLIVHYSEPVTIFQFKDRITAMSFTDDSESFLVASGYGGLALCTVEGEWVQGLEERSSPIMGLSNTVPGQIRAVSRDNKTLVWDISGVPLHLNNGEKRLVHGLAFHPTDPNLVLIGCGERRAEVWDFKTNTLLFQLDHADAVNAVAYTADGKNMLTASSDGMVKRWNAAGKLEREWRGHEAKIHGLAFSPDGSYLATASRDNTAKVWTSDGKLLYTLAGHDYDVLQVAFSPDGQQLVTAGGDDQAILWSMENGQMLRTFGGHGNYLTHATFSPDGRYLLTGDREGKVKLWRISKTNL